MSIPDSPGEIFNLFFTKDLLQRIVEETNRYTCQVMGREKYETLSKVTIEEMRAYLGFSVMMGVVDLPSFDDYWRKEPLLHYAPVAERISHTCFREISRYLHFVDNTTLAPREDPSFDRLGKVRPLLDYLGNKFEVLYQPSEHLAVDEAMIKFQGRSMMKQYMPMKPIKRGIKAWVRADSSNVFFWRIQIYMGRQENRDIGLGAHVVQSLMKGLEKKYHRVYFDNFFTSARLLEDLERSGVYACGTVRTNRKGFPPTLKNPRLSERYN